MLFPHPMLLAIVLPVVILGVGVLLAAKGHTRNRRLTLGAAIILAGISVAAVLIRDPTLLR